MTDPKGQTTPRRGRLLYEGKAKRVFDTNNPDAVLLDFKSEFPRRSHGGKGGQPPKYDCQSRVAEHIFQYLNSFRIPNHFIGRHSPSELLVRRMEMIPAAIVIRNIGYGSFCTRFGIQEGRELEFPVIELFYRNHQLDNPMVNDTHILAFGLATTDEVRTMVRIATKTNAVLRSFLERRHLRLVDFWMEFGRAGSDVFAGDALTPDCMRLVEFGSSAMYDGALYRLGLSDYADTYRQLCKRLLS